MRELDTLSVNIPTDSQTCAATRGASGWPPQQRIEAAVESDSAFQTYTTGRFSPSSLLESASVVSKFMGKDNRMV